MEKEEEHVIELYELWNRIKSRFGIIAPQPKHFSLRKEVIPVMPLDGYSFELIDLSDDTTVTHAPTTIVNTLQPPAGYIYEVVALYYRANHPVGDTAGTHKLKIIGQNSSFDYYASITSNFDVDITITGGYLFGGTSKLPVTAAYQWDVMHHCLFASYDQPLDFRYTNSLDVDQTGTRTLEVWVKKTAELI